MPNLKRWIITGASFGIGLAVTLLLAVGAYLWYEGRPKPPRPWNTYAISAHYDSVDTEGDENTIVFYYTLQNDLDYDYRILDASNVVLMAKLAKQKSLSGSKNDQYLKCDIPVLIPAKQRVRFPVHLGYPYKKARKTAVSREEREKFRREIESYLNEELTNLDGFVLFDEMNRYQINFPKGW